jgi:hypothetical protein
MPQLQAADRDLPPATVRIFRASYRVTQRLRRARRRRRWAPALAREADRRPLQSASPGSRRVVWHA